MDNIEYKSLEGWEEGLGEKTVKKFMSENNELKSKKKYFKRIFDDQKLLARIRKKQT